MWCFIADIQYNEDEEDCANDINDDDEHEGKMCINNFYFWKKDDKVVKTVNQQGGKILYHSATTNKWCECCRLVFYVVTSTIYLQVYNLDLLCETN